MNAAESRTAFIDARLQDESVDPFVEPLRALINKRFELQEKCDEADANALDALRSGVSTAVVHTLYRQARYYSNLLTEQESELICFFVKHGAKAISLFGKEIEHAEYLKTLS